MKDSRLSFISGNVLQSQDYVTQAYLWKMIKMIFSWKNQWRVFQALRAHVLEEIKISYQLMCEESDKDAPFDSMVDGKANCRFCCPKNCKKKISVFNFVLDIHNSCR